jgi:hypothetical protein
LAFGAARGAADERGLALRRVDRFAVGAELDADETTVRNAADVGLEVGMTSGGTLRLEIADDVTKFAGSGATVPPSTGPPPPSATPKDGAPVPGPPGESLPPTGLPESFDPQATATGAAKKNKHVRTLERGISL